MDTKAEIQSLGFSGESRLIFAEDTQRLMAIPAGADGTAAFELPGRHTQGDEEPEDSLNGDTWFKTSIGKLLVYAGGAWVGDTSPSPGPPPTPSSVVTPAGDYTVEIPSAGSTVGQRELIYVVPTAAISLSIEVGMLIPSDSLVTFPKALSANKLTVIQLMWTGVAWTILTVVGEC